PSPVSPLCPSPTLFRSPPGGVTDPAGGPFTFPPAPGQVAGGRVSRCRIDHVDELRPGQLLRDPLGGHAAQGLEGRVGAPVLERGDRKSTRLNSSHVKTS